MVSPALRDLFARAYLESLKAPQLPVTVLPPHRPAQTPKTPRG